VGVATVGIDHPFLAPFRGQLDAIVVHGDDPEAQPLMERSAGHEFLDALQRDFFGSHLFGHEAVPWRRPLRRHD
jgi:hypothetical protein